MSDRDTAPSSAGSPSVPALSVDHLSKRFGDRIAWSTWVGIAISTRSSDVRVAQQLSLLGNLPFVVVTSLIAFDVIPATPGLILSLGVLLLILDGLGWRMVSATFDRERLITGTR